VHGSAQSSLANSVHGRSTSSSSFTNSSSNSSPAHASKASHDLSTVAERLITGSHAASPSQVGSPHSGGSSNGSKSENGRGTALTALLDSAAVLAAAVALPPLITEMGLGESEPATFEALFSSSNDFSTSPRPTPTPDRSSSSSHGSENPTPDRPHDKARSSEDGQSTSGAATASDAAAGGSVDSDSVGEAKTDNDDAALASTSGAHRGSGSSGGGNGESIDGYGKPGIVRRASLEPTTNSSNSSSSSHHFNNTNSPRASGLGGPPHRRLPGASRSFNLGTRRDGSGSRGSTNSPARHSAHPSGYHHLPEWLASALPSGGERGLGGRRLQKRVVPGALPDNGGAGATNNGAGAAAGGSGSVVGGGSSGGGDLYEYPNGWPSSLDPSLLYHSEAQVPPALQALRLESSTQDRGFMARQLLTRSKGERRRRG